MVSSSDLAERVAQRLCHDFAGPIGAIVTAVDLLGDGGDAEINGLIADSARTLSASLRLHRLVYGPAGGEMPSGEARKLLAAWTATRADLTLDWAIDEDELPAGHAALLLGLAMLAGEAAPRGGTVRVEPEGVGVAATPLRFEPHVAAALEGGEADLAAGTALPRLLSERAASMGARLIARPGAEALRLDIHQGSSAPRKS